ncbi:MAG: MFS transporter [Chloroflexia bacterium]
MKVPALWRNRDYMLLWSGQVVSTLGSSMSLIVFPLLILALTGSPFAAGIAGALFMIPYVVFSLPAGALVDRWNRKRVMIVCDVVRAVAFLTIPAAWLFDLLTVWQLYAVALIEGTGFVFFNIAEVAALPRVVPKSQLPEATAQNMSTWFVASLIGPGLGGALYQGVGRVVPFLVDAVSYGLSAFSLLFIRTGFQGDRSVDVDRDLRAEIGQGIRWLWNRPLLRFIAFITGGINAAASALPLVIIVLAKNAGADDATVGLIFSIGAIGGIVGSIVGGTIQRRFTYGQVTIGSVWLLALMTPLYALTQNVILFGVISAVSSITFPVYSVVQMSYRLPLIPDELQGRVNSVFRLIAFGFQPLGATLGGILLEWTDPITTVLVVSAGFVGLAVAVTLSADVRNAPRHTEEQLA